MNFGLRRGLVARARGARAAIPRWARGPSGLRQDQPERQGHDKGPRELRAGEEPDAGGEGGGWYYHRDRARALVQ